MTTFYIVPAITDQAGQWRDVGIMSSQGTLVCLDASPAAGAAFRESEPLMAGLVFYNER
ncbi:hypothetical protein [Acidithiobacillus caldus]|uniref:hypothetical protein n=1 Tax=Acidithiobacillus caldus TaxID=33059 RepID=UPI0018E9EE76|nr:hypothetical protein [Acidithiobacillus caldus]